MRNIIWDKQILLIVISYLLYCLFSTPTHAYNLQHFTNKDGLSNSAILSIYQDMQGILWIGTCDGLNVFDSKDIQLYAPINVSNNLLSGNIISQIVESEPGILWLQTNYGLDRLDTYRQTSQSFTEFKDNIFLAQSNQNCMFVLKNDGYLYYYQYKKQKFIRLNTEAIDINKVLTMTIDSNNFLWIFATESATRCYRVKHTEDNISLIPENFFTQHGLINAFIGDNTAYLIDENNSLYEYNFSNRKYYYIADLTDEINKRGEVSSIITRGNDFCIGFKSSGLIILKYEENKKAKYRTEYTEIQSGVFTLMKDKFQDIVWVATDGDGLYMLYDNTFTITNTLLNTPLFQINNPVRCLYLDSQKTLWVGTKGSGLLCIPNYPDNHNFENHYRFLAKNSQLTDNSVYCLVSGGKDRLWIGTEQGINYYNYSTHQLKELKIEADGTKVKYVHSIHQTNDSTLWISTVGEGIVKATLTYIGGEEPYVKQARRTLINNGHMASNYFFTSYSEGDSLLWFGNRGLGTYCIDVRTEDTISYRFDRLVNSQTANDVFAIHKNVQGFWLGTGAGLIHFLPNTEENLDTPKAKLYTPNTVHGILEDNSDNLWISTNQGLIKLNPQKQTLQTFNYENGLTISEFSDGAFYKDNATGTLFFGGVNGFVTMKPNSYIATDYMPEITLKELSIFGKKYNLYDFQYSHNGKNILKLDYKHNFLQLHFQATDYINGNDYQYFYKLKEASSQWIDNGTSSNAIFSNLAPGEYTLLVKYRNNISGKESKQQTFIIHITPPWYLSFWAYTSYIIFALLLCTGITIYAVHTYRKKRLNIIKEMERQKKEEVYESKLRFFTNITHEFCTPLTLIQGPCEKILSQTGTGIQTQRYAKMIQQNVKKLNELIVELLEFRRLETGNKTLSIKPQPVSEKVREIAESFNEMAVDRDMNYQLKITPELIWNTDISCLNKISENLLSNAFKYTPDKGSIVLNLYTAENKLILKIANTGKGITPENLDKIFDRYRILDSVETNGKNSRNGLGLAICKSMVSLLKGEIDIESTPNKLTTFTVSLPILAPNGLEIPQTSYENASPILSPKNTQIIQKKTHEVISIDKSTIIIVDDDPSMLWFISEIFTEEYNVLPCENAQEALNYLEQQQIDLIISDVMMPNIDGLSFASSVKQNKLWGHIPLILLSALHQEDDQVKGIESGADAYITKPFNIKYLEKIVYRLIHREKELKEYYYSAFSTFSWKKGNCLHKEEQDFLDKMTDIIEKNLGNPDFQVDLLSKEMGYSSRQFYRKLKSLTEKSPADIIKEYRLSAAERLLMSSNFSIEEIMERTGFVNKGTFYKVFSFRYGMPPRQYCEQQKRIVKTESLL